MNAIFYFEIKNFQNIINNDKIVLVISMYVGLFLTFLTGLFFLIGIYSFKNNKNREETSLFTISLAFVVMLGLLIFDLLPHILEHKNILLIIPCIIGFITLVFLDKLIPHHYHEHNEMKCDKHDHALHLNHIGIVTIIALAIHNMIEGLTLYSVTLNSVKSGILMMMSISLHNIPLGFQIGNSLKNKKYSKLLIFLLCISSLLGALVFMFFGSLNETIISILLSLTFGMLLYILIFELFNEIKSSLKKKETLCGILLGIVILIITFMI